MEMNSDGPLKRLLFAERVPFSEKRDVNWRNVKWGLIGIVGFFVLGVLILPGKPQPEPEAKVAAVAPPSREPEPQQAFSGSAKDLSRFYQNPAKTSSPPNRQTSMIVSRGGLDYRTQLPPGTRIKLKLLQSVIVSSESMPVVALTTEDVEQENGTAIEKGAKVFGEASFSDTGDVASVNWTSIQMADGRERQLVAVGVSSSGQVGVPGHVHSRAAQNIAGGTISRFIEAYADGSVSRSVLGFSEGGDQNGFKTAVAATAKDQADSFANDLKKEKRWIELEAGAECLAVLKQPFAFRDPGTYAK
jgi:type IV secretory pathway VirB10-like protein